MAAIDRTLASCSAEPPVFYEDEVDIHLNLKISADWQLRGQQKRVVTPGQNEKYYLAGALQQWYGKSQLHKLHTLLTIDILYVIYIIIGGLYFITSVILHSHTFNIYYNI